MIVSESDNEERIFSFLEINDIYFTPNLSSRVELKAYAKKLANNSINIFLTNEEGEDIGHAAVYINSGFSSFLTSFCINWSVYNTGASSVLMNKVFISCLERKSNELELEVNKLNVKAIEFYRKHGFYIKKEKSNELLMKKEIKIQKNLLVN